MFDRYIIATNGELQARLAVVCGELAMLHRELANLYADETRAKIKGFMASQESSVAGRERDAASHALEATCAIYDVKGQVLALNEEKQFILKLLES